LVKGVWYILTVLNLLDLFFNSRFGQFGVIRVEYNWSGHKFFKIVLLKFLRFSFIPFFRRLLVSIKRALQHSDGIYNSQLWAVQESGL